MGKNFEKRGRKKSEKLEIIPVDENVPLPPQRQSDDIISKKKKGINKDRVLVFAARGISYRDRHLMKDLKTLMPHHKAESKMQRSKRLAVINEMCEMKHCNKCILFEGRLKRDLYMWISNIPFGPSAKFLVENIHTMAELKLTGNCFRGSRPLLSFDAKFDEIPHLKLLKELLTQTFGVPNYHPKSQPFIDHVYTFTYLHKRIWFRNFQILSEDGGLVEIGPRFVLNPVKIFEGSFTGIALWENPDYVSPAKQRQILKKAVKERYVNRVEQKVHHEATLPKNAYENGAYDEIFEDNDLIEAAKLLKGKAKEKRMEKAKQKKITEVPKDSLTKKIKEKQIQLIRGVIAKRKNTAKNIRKT
uniref:Ribosome biogenesis protein BRX1 homolog n=1 Tax=Glossina austeni TaxID=7395 RepID=A0A1A9UTQ7_GLOAU